MVSQILPEQRKRIKEKIGIIVLLSVIFSLFFLGYYKLYSSFKYAAYISEIRMPAQEECINVEGQDYYLIVENVYNLLDPFYELDWVNNTSENVYFEWYDYGYTYEGTAPTLVEAKIIAPQERFFYRNMEENNNYTLKIYGTRGVSEESFRIPAGNTRMMDNYKIAAILVAASIMVWGIIISFVFWKYGEALCRKITGIAAIIVFLLGMIFFVLEKEYYYIDGFAILSSFCAACGIVFSERDEIDKKKDYKYNNIAISVIISTIIACVIFAIMCNAKEGSWLYQFSPKEGANIKDYIIVMSIYGMSFIMLSFLFLKLKIGGKIEFYFANKETYLTLLITLFNMIRFHMGIESRTDRWILFPVFVLVFAGCYFFLTKKNIPRWILICIYSVCIFLTAIKSVGINFYQTSASVHHVGTYYDSIYYLAEGMPFQGGGIDIYGHYSLIYAFFLKIFGKNLLTIGIVNFVLCGLISWFAISCIDRIAKNDALKLLAAISLFAMSGPVYLQIMPCRLLFPFGILYYILCCCNKKLTLKKKILGYLLCVFAIFWNTESGLVCALTFAVFCSLMKIRNRDKSLIRFMGCVCVQFIIVIVECLLAFSTVSMYNKCVLSHNQPEVQEEVQTEVQEEVQIEVQEEVQIEVQEEVQPEVQEEVQIEVQEEVQSEVQEEEVDSEKQMGSALGVLVDDHYMSNVTVPIEWGNLLWVYGMIVYFGLFAIYFSKTGIFGKSEEKPQDIFYICTAVMCLGIYTYYIFRSETFMIVEMLSVLVLVIILNLGLSNMTENSYTVKNIILKLISCGALFGLVATLTALPSTLKDTYNVVVEEENCNWTMLRGEMEAFVNEIPEDTIVNGNGISMIYMSLGLPLPNSDHPKYLLSNFDISSYMRVYKKVSIFDYEYTLYYYE